MSTLVSCKETLCGQLWGLLMGTRNLFKPVQVPLAYFYVVYRTYFASLHLKGDVFNDWYEDYHDCLPLALFTSPGLSCPYTSLYFGSLQLPRRGRCDPAHWDSKMKQGTKHCQQCCETTWTLPSPLANFFLNSVAAPSSIHLDSQQQTLDVGA